MSKKTSGQGESKYLNTFFATPKQTVTQGNVSKPSFSQKNVSPSASMVSEDKKKFCNPSGFFSSQSNKKLSEPVGGTFKPRENLSEESKMKQKEWNIRFEMAQHELLVTKEEQSKKDKNLAWGKNKPSPPEDETNQKNDPWFSDDFWGENEVKQLDSFDKQILPKKHTPNKFLVPKVVANPQPATIQSKDPLQSLLDDSEEFFNTQFKELDDFSLLAEKLQDNGNFSSKTIKPRTEDFSSQFLLDKDEEFFCNITLPEKVTNTQKETTTVRQANKIKSQELEKLTCSQRKMEKQSRSLPSSSQVKSQSHSLDWLRTQLEVTNSKLGDTKQNLVSKEGECKLLRQKLKDAESKINKQKADKTNELTTVKATYEQEIKELKKKLSAAQTQAMLKDNECRSKISPILNKSVQRLSSPAPKYQQKSLIWPAKLSFRDKSNQDDTIVIHDSTCEKDSGLVASSSTTDEKSNTKKLPDVEVIEISSTEEPEVVITKPKPTRKLRSPSSKQSLIGPNKAVQHSGTLFSRMLPEEIFQPALLTINHCNIPNVDYIPRPIYGTELLVTEMSNYNCRRPTVFEIWNINYDEFGPVKLTEYEKAKVGEPIEPDVAKSILGKSTVFSTLEPIYITIIKLKGASIWGKNEFFLAKQIIDHVLQMARELYAALADIRFRELEDTVSDRDSMIIEECLNINELDKKINIFSKEKWKNEAYVDLRRGIALVGLLCAANENVANYILNPKVIPYTNYKAAQENKSYTNEVVGQVSPQCLNNPRLPSSVLSQRNKSPPIRTQQDMTQEELFDINLSVFTSTKDPKVVSELSPKLDQIPNYESSKLDIFVKKSMGIGIIDETMMETSCFTQTETKSLDLGLNFCQPESIMDKNNTSFTEQNSKTELRRIDKALKDSGVQSHADVFKKPRLAMKQYDSLESEKLREIRESIQNIMRNVSQEKIRIDINNIKPKEKTQDEVKNPFENNKRDKIKSALNKFKEHNFGKTVERELPNTEQGKKHKSDSMVNYSRGELIMSELKKQRSDSSGASGTTKEITKDKKFVLFDPLPSSLEEKTQDFETSTASIGPQKFALLKNSMLSSVSITKQKVKKEDSDVNEGDAVEIEFDLDENEVVDDEFEDDEGPEDCEERLKLMQEPRPDLEYISDKIEKWSRKLKEADFLELLSETIKDSGTLRLTSEINGIMTAIVFLFKHLLQFQKNTCELYVEKIITVIREIVYTRPPPSVMLELNIFLGHAVTCPSFTLMLCHNADGKKFSAVGGDKWWARGTCFLQVFCLIVDNLVVDNTKLNMCFYFTKWVDHIISYDGAPAYWFDEQNKKKRRCCCVIALVNTYLNVYYQILSKYDYLIKKNKNDNKLQSYKQVVLSGLRNLYFMSRSDQRFVFHIKERYWRFQMVLEIISNLHESELSDFVLSSMELSQLRSMLNLSMKEDERNLPAINPSEELEENFLSQAIF